MIMKAPKSNKPPKALKSPKSSPSYRCGKTFAKVYQFKVTLLDADPPIWRRIQVPGCYSFWDLHCAITDAFGWLDYHLHLFKVLNPKTGQMDHMGIPAADEPDDAEMMGYETLPDSMRKISNYFTKDNIDGEYMYDFGDDWRHSIVLEEIVPRDKTVAYPRCIAGEKACPPEDCGGIGGYHQFKKAIQYKNAPRHDELLQWVGGWFDPEWFELGLIRFADPALRWRVAFEEARAPKSLRMVQYHQMKPKAKGCGRPTWATRTAIPPITP